MGYSQERKNAVVRRMLPPANMAIRQLSQEEGIAQATLPKWRAEARGKGQLLPGADVGPESWSSRDEFAAVVATAAAAEVDLGKYCRRRGVYPAQIKAWRLACAPAKDWARTSTARLSTARRSPTAEPSAKLPKFATLNHIADQSGIPGVGHAQRALV